MAKLLLLVVGVWLVLTILKRYQKNMSDQQKPKVSEDMVKCAHCGVHLPKSESIFINQRYYCCQEHSND
jgi:uncharacterized protein